MPFIVGILPIAGLVFLDPSAEWLFLSTSLVMSTVVVTTACVRGHRRRLPLVPFSMGALVLVAAHLGPDPDGLLARGMIVTGATLVTAGHALNIYFCRCDGARADCRHAEANRSLLEDQQN